MAGTPTVELELYSTWAQQYYEAYARSLAHKKSASANSLPAKLQRRITGLGIMEAIRDARPGMFEYELQADAESPNRVTSSRKRW